jgi:hypothetical protein
MTFDFRRVGTLWLPRQPVMPPEPPVTIRMVGSRRMQCKDIPDEAFLDAVRRAGPTGTWRMRWDVQTELEKTLGPIPGNLLMAKARKLKAAGKMGGCDCGCRGDWHPVDECDDRQYCCRPRKEQR